MRTPAVPPSPSSGVPGGVPGRSVALLGALTVALVGAFVVAPRLLAASGGGGGVVGVVDDERDLARLFRTAFVEYWSSGDRGFPVDLQGLVDYWSRYHVVKAVIAAILLAVLAGLDVLLWRAFVRSGGRRSAVTAAATASAGVLVTMLAVLSLMTVMANVQGAVAPFASLLPMLAVAAAGTDPTATLDQVRQSLAESLRSGHDHAATVDVMINDFSRYHVVMAVIAGVVAIALAGTAVAWWRRFTRTSPTERRARWVIGSFGVLSAVLSLVVMVLAVANTTTAADPAPALLAFFQGGW